jgi:hypothetical protein
MTNPTTTPKTLRVICDGTTAGTRILDANGNLIGRVQSLQIDIDIQNRIPTMSMKMAVSELDILVPEDGVTVQLDD